jgi:hypothetical protein
MATMLELTAVLILKQNMDKRNVSRIERSTVNEQTTSIDTYNVTQKIDLVCAVLFPMFYLLFNCFYWFYYLSI